MGLFGFARNYDACRYFGGLFCKRWCHRGEMRVVPAHSLLHWDNAKYRVGVTSAGERLGISWRCARRATLLTMASRRFAPSLHLFFAHGG